ncbi:hypothetical protein IE077_002762 [Cardiosporidium cionae]|uniref:Uncharacterized protein n=1 Tax=Cardiosporidium cionae TaxID=476202 RepID=A0ABQ7JA27_9APIC|nr:hypothetical protein IE077_002762 [Cardiosporidium cionae]|eukprot:KAF8820831.1 hypothetical protein IE077_002762 [Cardiosporidium cionae]
MTETASANLPNSVATLRERIVKETDRFLAEHQLRLKIRRLPLSGDESSSPTPTDCLSNQFPAYHFITRQKRHLTEQLLRNRSSYQTEFNTTDDDRNKHTPFILKEIPETVKDHLNKMANDFDDPEFSESALLSTSTAGPLLPASKPDCYCQLARVWLSLHSPPFTSNSEYGHLVRSKIVGWALIEVLTTNERCLKALWVHPKLSATATTTLLLGFLPRVLFEAFELVAPQQTSEGCSWKFLYAWLNDFAMFPRQTWLILCASEYFGLPKHCDTLGDPAGVTPGHVDEDDPVGLSCPCQKSATWDDWDQILVGCTESFMYKHMEQWLEIIPKKPSEHLLGIANILPTDEPEPLSQLPKETIEEIEVAEFLGLNRKKIASILLHIYGRWCHDRIQNMESYLEGINEEFQPNAGSSNKRRIAEVKTNAKRERT